MTTTTDVAIVGGGIMGAALAYWLTRLAPGTRVTVVERDPAWTQASSALSAASIRQQYTTAVNVRISQASLEFLRTAREALAVDGDGPDLGLHEGGYLYLADPPREAALRAAHAFQRAHGVEVAWLDRAALGARFPWLATDDLAGGTLGVAGEGWFDGYALLAAFARRARAQGAGWRRDEAVGFLRDGLRVAGVRLAGGETLAAGAVVNAAGPWARAVARWAGIDLPVHARRRTVFVVACPQTLPRCPLLIDPSGWWLRPEGTRFIGGGAAPRPDPDDLPLEPDCGPFEDEFWPALARRIPAFESARLERAWAGYYEMNDHDHNGLIGTLPEAPGLWFLNGFSGHGLQQAPVVARGLAERILVGRDVSLDLADLDVRRLAEGRRLLERNVIG